jgi:hypothetical protein
MRRYYILIPMLLVLVSLVAAEIRMDVTSYNPDTRKARILLSNTGPDDYHDITFALDEGKPMQFPGSLLKVGTAITVPKLVEPGTHTVTVTTREGATFTKQIVFAPSGKQVENIRVKDQAVAAATPAGQLQESPEAESPKFTWLVVLLVVLLVAVAAFFYLKKNPGVWQRVLAWTRQWGARLSKKQLPMDKPGSQGLRQPLQRSGQPFQRQSIQRPGQQRQPMQRQATPIQGQPAQRGPTQPQRDPRQLQRPPQRSVQPTSWRRERR